MSLSLLLVVAAGCAGGAGSRSVPVLPAAAASLAPSASGFKVPAAITRAVPPKPPGFIPVMPSNTRRAASVTPGTHPAFFAGEAPLGNGVYYLSLPNGNPFGYYSYLSDPRYIYHFDMGYEYIADANDGQGGIYFYDFASQHWWFTGRSYPFPYVYDFSLSAILYYYPNAGSAGHYTTGPRYFHDFVTGSDITPDQNPDLLLQPTAIQFYQALSYRSGGGNCTNGPSTFCVGTDNYAAGSQYGILPHQKGGYQGPWGLQTTNAAVAQAYNCDGNAQTDNGRFFCGYPNTGMSVLAGAPGSTTVTVTGANNISNPIYVNVTETSVVVNLQNLTDAVSMQIVGNYDNNLGGDPQQGVTFGRTLSASEQYTVMNFPAQGSTNTLTVNISNGVSFIATGTVSGISIDPLHANTITITPQRTH